MDVQDGEELRGDEAEATLTTLLDPVATPPSDGGEKVDGTRRPSSPLTIALACGIVVVSLIATVGLCYWKEELQQQWESSPLSPPSSPAEVLAPSPLPPPPPTPPPPPPPPSCPSSSLSSAHLNASLLHLTALLSAYRTFHPSWQRMGSPLDFSNASLVHSESQALPPCGVLSGREQGRWGLSPSRDWAFHPQGCELRRPTPQQAKQCLTNQSLSFVGDSLLRYQYLSLISFLHNKEWPEPLGGLPGLPSILIEKEWGSWEAFFAASKGAFNGHESCGGCQRGASSGSERRHFHLSDSGTTVRFLFVTKALSFEAGMEDVREEWLAMRRGNVSQPYRYLKDAQHNLPQSCAESSSPDCHYPPSVPFHPSTFLLANIGQWFSDRVLPSDLLPVFTAARDAVDMADLPMKRMWRMTTPRIGGEDIIAHNEEWQVFGGGAQRWEVLEVFNMTAQPHGVTGAYWDNQHFLPFVYQEMNVWLLNTLCDEHWQWRSLGQ